MVKRLKEGGAAWNVADNAGHVALTWAVDGGHAEVVNYILKDGFPVRTIHPSHACDFCVCVQSKRLQTMTQGFLAGYF